MNHRKWLIATLIVLVPLLLLTAVVLMMAGGNDKIQVERGETFSYTIANGVHDRIEGGETVSIIPFPLNMRLGDVLEIKNEDSYTHTVGPFVIRAGEALEHQFVKVGRYVGACTVHPSGKAEIIVS